MSTFKLFGNHAYDTITENWIHHAIYRPGDKLEDGWNIRYDYVQDDEDMCTVSLTVVDPQCNVSIHTTKFSIDDAKYIHRSKFIKKDIAADSCISGAGWLWSNANSWTYQPEYYETWEKIKQAHNNIIDSSPCEVLQKISAGHTSIHQLADKFWQGQPETVSNFVTDGQDIWLYDSNPDQHCDYICQVHHDDNIIITLKKIFDMGWESDAYVLQLAEELSIVIGKRLSASKLFMLTKLDPDNFTPRTKTYEYQKH